MRGLRDLFGPTWPASVGETSHSVSANFQKRPYELIRPALGMPGSATAPLWDRIFGRATIRAVLQAQQAEGRTGESPRHTKAGEFLWVAVKRTVLQLDYLRHRPCTEDIYFAGEHLIGAKRPYVLTPKAYFRPISMCRAGPSTSTQHCTPS